MASTRKERITCMMINSIYVGLTSIRGRERALMRTLLTLLQQNRVSSVKQIKLYLFISHDSYLLDAGFQYKPWFVSAYERTNLWGQIKFKTIFTENIGPYRKLIPLARIAQSDNSESDPMLITADDDTLYPRNWIQRLVDAQLKFNCVVAFRGRQIWVDKGIISPYKDWIKSGKVLGRPSLMTLPTGKDGICYRMSHLHAGAYEQNTALEYAGHADDLWFKIHTLLTGTSSVLLHSELSMQFPELTKKGHIVNSSTKQGDIESLFLNINKTGGNDKALYDLNRWLQSNYDTSLYRLLHADVFG